MIADTHTDLLRDSVRNMLAEFSASEKAPRSAALWAAAIAQGLTNLCSGDDSGTLEDALIVMTELGRVASSLPIWESVVANLFAPGLASSSARIGLAIGETGGDFESGLTKFENGVVSGAVRLVDGAIDADVFLVLCENSYLCLVPADVDVEVRWTPALAPNLADLHLNGAPADGVRFSRDKQQDLLTILRLGMCARAYGAAHRGFEAVVEYAKLRKQFGQVIGSFQAIQHKLADSRILLEGCRLQLTAAAQAYDEGSDRWRAVCGSAIAFSSQSLRCVALETQHCFGAIGFAEEHEAPALFRRVHGDLARYGGAVHARLEFSDHLLDDSGCTLASLFAQNNDPAAPFRERLRSWLETNWSDDDREAAQAKPYDQRIWDLEFAKKLGSGDWTTLNWPGSVGGMDATPFEQLAFTEELLNAGTSDYPLLCGCRVMAPEIIAHGSDALREAMLPGLRAGTLSGCLGYSEPEAGSDLASLRTKAFRDGDDYVVNGQKIWTTDGHRATHMLLAARTHPDLNVKHAGISLFVLPMTTPGISVLEMDAMYGPKFCNIFFDDVRFPAAWRLGEENEGWKILSNALSNERIAMGGLVLQLQVLLDKLIQQCCREEKSRPNPIVRERIAGLVSELVTGRHLALRSLELMSAGQVPLVEAAMAKVYASELAQRICETALDLLGGRGLFNDQSAQAPANGIVEQMLRTSIMFVIGGGSNEIQRSVIARRGLGLGR